MSRSYFWIKVIFKEQQYYLTQKVICKMGKQDSEKKWKTVLRFLCSVWYSRDCSF